MNRQALRIMLQRISDETAEAFNCGGRAVSALLRIVLVAGMVVLIALGSFLNLLDEQLEFPRGKSERINA